MRKNKLPSASADGRKGEKMQNYKLQVAVPKNKRSASGGCHIFQIPP